jgi:hypothetical protein
MIRPGRFTDQPAIEALLRGAHARSKYAGRVAIHDKALSQTVLGAIAAMTQNGPQASHVAVAERGGEVVGVIIGALDRVYHIGEKLSANDIFFVVGEKGSFGDSLYLADSYIAWARSNPKVIEIMLSWSDAIPGGEKIAALAKRKAFIKTGEMFEMRLDQPAAVAA